MENKSVTPGESRRAFIKASTAGLAISSSVLGANDRVQMGVIGVGMRGNQVHGSFIKHKDVAFVAACDVRKDRLDQFVTKNADAKMNAYSDYRRILERKDIDAVLITTPDHWHMPMMVAACEAGKDVYVEKPVSNTCEAGVKMVEAADKYKRVVQVGLQQRSWDHFQECYKMVKEGLLGKITHCVMNFGSSYTQVTQPATQPPGTIDWDAFQGPAPKKPFSPSRLMWRSYYDYGGGILTDWGVHLMDVANWFMDADAKAPLITTCSAQYVRVPPDKEQIPDAIIASFQYDNFVGSFTNQAMPNPDFELWGNYFFGEKGTLLLNRTGYMIRPAQVRRFPGAPEPPKPIEAKMFKNPAGMSEDPNSTFASATMNHARNFLDCVKSRQRTACPMDVGFNSTLPGLLAIVSIQSGGKAVSWDGKAAKTA